MKATTEAEKKAAAAAVQERAIKVVTHVPLGEWFGVRGVFMVGGVLSGAAALAGFLSPALRRLDAPVGPPSGEASRAG